MRAVYYYPFEVVIEKTTKLAYLKRGLKGVTGDFTCCQCHQSWPCGCPETEEEDAERARLILSKNPSVIRDRISYEKYLSQGGCKYSVGAWRQWEKDNKDELFLEPCITHT